MAVVCMSVYYRGRGHFGSGFCAFLLCVRQICPLKIVWKVGPIHKSFLITHCCMLLGERAHLEPVEQNVPVPALCSVMSHLWCPVDCSPPGSSVPGVSQARLPEWAAISSSRELPDPGIEPASLASPTLADPSTSCAT